MKQIIESLYAVAKAANEAGEHKAAEAIYEAAEAIRRASS